MPLFSKKDSNKKIKKDGKDDKSPSVEDKYVLKELLGTYVFGFVADCAWTKKVMEYDHSGFLSFFYIMHKIYNKISKIQKKNQR